MRLRRKAEGCEAEENLRRFEFATGSYISSLATHISNLAEVLFGFVAHAIRRNGIGIEVSSSTGAIAILGNIFISIKPSV